PEQVRGRPGDARTDFYALGAILYEALAGTVPFPDDDGGAAKLHRPPEPLRVKRPDVPADLERVILRCLAIEPEDRPDRALELRDALAFPQSLAPEHEATGGLATSLGTRGMALVGAVALAAYAFLAWLLTNARR